MSDKLVELFPEIELIQDADIRRRTIETLLDAMELGGWSFQDLDVVPFTLLIKDTDVSFRQHTRAVTRMAIACAKIMQEEYANYYKINMDHVVAGSLLHDVGKLLEYKRTGDEFVKSRNGKLLRHPFSGTGLCTKHGLPDEVIHIVAVHAKEGQGGYRLPEAVALHHADFINFEPLKDL